MYQTEHPTSLPGYITSCQKFYPQCSSSAPLLSSLVVAVVVFFSCISMSSQTGEWNSRSFRETNLCCCNYGWCALQRHWGGGLRSWGFGQPSEWCTPPEATDLMLQSRSIKPQESALHSHTHTHNMISEVQRCCDAAHVGLSLHHVCPFSNMCKCAMITSKATIWCFG